MKYLVLLICIHISYLGYSQTNYYVSPTGNNTNNGSLSSPWNTIQFSLNQLSNGDTLNLFSGTYNEKIQIPNDGIFLRNKQGENPTIDATGINNQVSIVEIYDINIFTIEGIELQNNIMLDAQGIVVENNCQNITIKNCKIHDIHFSSNINAPVNATKNAQGIIVYGTDGNNTITNLKILNNELYNCRLGYSEGIAVNGNVDGFEVSGNLVHDITNIGIDLIGFEGTSSNNTNDQARNGLIKNNIIYNCISPYATSGGIYIDGGKDIVVENNTAYHNGYGIEIGCENVGKTTDNITVRNNIFYDNEVSAMAFGGFDYPSGSGKVINSTFRNNTCYYNDFSNQGNGEMYLSYTENCIIENNIFYASTEGMALYQDIASLNLSMNYNLYYTTSNTLEFNLPSNISYVGLTAFSQATGYENNSVSLNPNFVTPSISSPDYHLQVTSPAINAGNPSYTVAAGETDMDNQNRAVGIIDCGADEYDLASNINTVPNLSQIKIYPNPSKGIFYSTLKGNFTIQVFDIAGKLIFSSINNSTVNLTSINSGVYFIKIKTVNTVYTTKLFKD